MPECQNCGMVFMSHELDRNELCENCARQARAANSHKPKSCVRCGDHGLFLYLDPEGYCENCRPAVDAERKAQRHAERLAQYYQSCQNGTARPDVQRIYNAFRAKYPDALITGIEAKDEGKRVIVHLEGGDKYSVVFNALTNDVDVSKVDKPFVEQRPISEDNFHVVAPEEKKKGGCLSTILKAICWVVGIYFACAFLVTLSSELSSKPSSKPKVTAAPTATAPISDVASWVKHYAKSSLPDDTKLDSVEYLPQSKRLYVICEMDSMWNGKAYLKASAEFVSNFCSRIRTYSGLNDDVTVIVIVNGPFIDKEGNDMIAVGVRAEYSFEKIQRLNYEYFDNALYSHPEWIIEAADEYKISPAYLK